MIYLDYAANTPVDKDVLKEFVGATTKYIGNPNSRHKAGLLAKEKIDECSYIIANYFNIESDNIIYTSGASESNNLVIKGVSLANKEKGKHIIISPLEHSSIIAPVNFLTNHGYEVSVLKLKSNGQVDLEDLKNTIRDDTVLVSVCYVDSELGTIQPIDEIGKIVSRFPNCVFHTDATQAVGKIKVDFKYCDFVTFAPHKFYGLNGFGVLFNLNNEKIIPLIHGGKSTTVYRSGTPVTANVVACSKAIQIALDNLEERYEYILGLKKYLIEELEVFSNVHINSPKNSIPSTLNFSLINIDANKVVRRIEEDNICVSRTSACSLGNTPSKAVYAITDNLDMAKNSIRVSLSHMTTMKELEKFISVFKSIYDEELKHESNKD